MSNSNKCPSVHKWSGQQCIREAGHDGRCWGKSQSGTRTIIRAEWISENGVFVKHYTYDTRYPANMAKN